LLNSLAGETQRDSPEILQLRRATYQLRIVLRLPHAALGPAKTPDVMLQICDDPDNSGWPSQCCYEVEQFCRSCVRVDGIASFAHFAKGGLRPIVAESPLILGQREKSRFYRRLLCGYDPSARRRAKR
jgi:hypothetical protein